MNHWLNTKGDNLPFQKEWIAYGRNQKMPDLFMIENFFSCNVYHDDGGYLSEADRGLWEVTPKPTRKSGYLDLAWWRALPSPAGPYQPKWLTLHYYLYQRIHKEVSPWSGPIMTECDSVYLIYW